MSRFLTVTVTVTRRRRVSRSRDGADGRGSSLTMMPGSARGIRVTRSIRVVACFDKHRTRSDRCYSGRGVASRIFSVFQGTALGRTTADSGMCARPAAAAWAAVSGRPRPGSEPQLIYELGPDLHWYCGWKIGPPVGRRGNWDRPNLEHTRRCDQQF